MMEFYNHNADFKRYVDRYCNQYGLTVEEAMEHDGEFIAVHEVVSRVKK